MEKLVIILMSILNLPCVLSAVNDNYVDKLKYKCSGKDSECYTEKSVDLELCGSKKCIYKCCPKGEVIGLDSCVPAETNGFSNITVYDYYLNPIDKNFYDIFSVVSNKFADEGFKTAAYAAHNIGQSLYLEENGVIYVEMPNQLDRWIAISDLCIDYEVDENNTLSSEPYYYVNYSIPETREKPTDILVIALSVSSFFMFLIILIYALYPTRLSLLVKIRMGLVSSYICHFIFLAIIISKRHSGTTCVVLSFIAYFSILSTCCWLNVMSYDTWLTFSDLTSRNYSQSERKRLEGSKFRRYIAYGWGLPLCMSIALITINSIDMSGVPWFVTPQIPNLGCFLRDGQQLVYQYIPMMILVFVNCVFFVLTALNIAFTVRQTGALGPNNKQRQKARLKICLRLSVTMGISWVWEIISFLVPAADKFALYLDLYNGLIGLLIFLIFVCNKKTVSNLKLRYEMIRGRHVVNGNGTSQFQMNRMKSNKQINADI